ncbi:MAG: ATP-grasp domain-containing protein [Elusimicrobia bacterium]|nr:ATP-grasp domain-containing protein [Elusimicrobiota bacterium]
MKKVNILIPTAGNRVQIIKNFRSLESVNKVVTADIDELAPAMYFADKCYLVARTASDEYPGQIKRICMKEKIDWIFPLSDLDILFFDSKRDYFRDTAGIFIAPGKTIEVCADKYATWKLLGGQGLSVPRTVLLSGFHRDEWKYPVFLKSRHIGDKNSGKYILSKIKSDRELEYMLGMIEDRDRYLIQEYLAGQEVNVDFFVNGSGKLVDYTPLKRLQAGLGGGITRGETIEFGELEKTIEALMGLMDFYGPSNFQIYMDRDRTYKITEINPRFSNSSILVREAGVDYYDMSVRLIKGETLNKAAGKCAKLYMTSAYIPVFLSEKDISGRVRSPDGE